MKKFQCVGSVSMNEENRRIVRFANWYNRKPENRSKLYLILIALIVPIVAVLDVVVVSNEDFVFYYTFTMYEMIAVCIGMESAMQLKEMSK
jgi:hypothetical protein